MKKLITATTLAALALASTAALAEDTKQNSPTQKTPTQQQMETKSTDAAKKPAAATTGSSMNAPIKPGDSKVPGKPTDTVKDSSK
jgi:hypothetical protein